MYSDSLRYFPDNYVALSYPGFGQSIHIEHSVPKSWWGCDIDHPDCAAEDLNHLFPADGKANISKNDNPLGVVTGVVSYSNGVSKIGYGSYTGYSGTVFEPADKFKGDFARAYFYMATAYEHYVNKWDTSKPENMIGISQVTSNNPTGKNISKTLDVNGAYTFTTSDFGFSSPLSNTFAGIKVVTLPTSGTLALSGAAITAGQMVSDVTHLAYTAGSGSGSFTYRILDSGGLMSDATYTAAFTVSGTSTITVRFQKPDAWSAVYFYACSNTSRYWKSSLG